MASIICGNCKGKHGNVKQVKMCYAGALYCMDCGDDFSDVKPKCSDCDYCGTCCICLGKNDLPKIADAATVVASLLKIADNNFASVFTAISSSKKSELAQPVPNASYLAQYDEQLNALIEAKQKHEAEDLSQFLLDAPVSKGIQASPGVVVHKLPAPATPVTEPGLYKKPNGIVYRVKWNKTKTHLYAEKVDATTVYGKPRFMFTYYAGMMKELTAEMRMTVADAVTIGKSVGACCQCGRTLTKKVSVEAGIGPICAGKI